MTRISAGQMLGVALTLTAVYQGLRRVGARALLAWRARRG
jgi:hypothetical protein